jgi:hypothetical protein
MTDEPLEHDAALSDALTDIAGDARDTQPAWAELRGAINAHAASELRRRRLQRRRARFVMPASLAAGIALFMLVSRLPDRTLAPSVHNSGAAQVSIDDLLDANVTDGQFRALVSGASDANELLSIAAGESQ